MASNLTFWLVILSYIVIVWVSYIFQQPIANQTAEDDSIGAASINALLDQKNIDSITLGKRNATQVIKLRSKEIKIEYEKLLQSDGWKILRTGTNVSVETLEPSNSSKWPLYIKTTTNLDASPRDALSLFEVSQLESTSNSIDPFIERISLHFEPSKEFKVIRRTTKKIALLPRREFNLAILESTQQQAFTFPISNQKHSPLKNAVAGQVNVPKGSLYQEYVTVRVTDEFPSLPYPSNGKYIKSFQDCVVWYLDDGNGGTNLVSLMQVDLGSDVPRWFFTHTVGAIGIWSIHSLIKLIHKKFSRETKK